MTPVRFQAHLALALSLFLLSACASPIYRAYREAAAPDLTFDMVLEEPDAYKGKTVIWGGVIFRTVNTGKGGSLFVLETPLGHMDKPGGGDEARGRFIAEGPYYLDPLIYERGRKVTVAGVVEGKRAVAGLEGKQPYVYPVLKIGQLYLWRREPADYPPGNLGWPGGWYDPYYWQYGGPRGGGPSEGDFGGEAEPER
jgi:outer membrane lipoprotein